MKILFILLFFSSLCQAQKTVDIWRRPVSNEYLVAIFTGDSLRVSLLGQNSSYKYIVDYITIFSGSPKEFVSFVDSLKTFSASSIDNKTSYTIQLNNRDVTLRNYYGIIQLLLYDDNDYHIMRPAWLLAFKEKLVEWAKKNNIAI